MMQNTISEYMLTFYTKISETELIYLSSISDTKLSWCIVISSTDYLLSENELLACGIYHFQTYVPNVPQSYVAGNWSSFLNNIPTKAKVSLTCRWVTVCNLNDDIELATVDFNDNFYHQDLKRSHYLCFCIE